MGQCKQLGLVVKLEQLEQMMGQLVMEQPKFRL